MSIKISLKQSTGFAGLMITPALAPEKISLQTAGKEAGDIRMIASKAVLSLGAQNKLSAELIRRAGGSLARWLDANDVTTAGVELGPLLGTGMSPSTSISAFAEGILLGAFSFNQYKSDKQNKDIDLSLLVDSGAGVDMSTLQGYIQRTTVVAEAVNLAREWSHEPPNVINPVSLAERIKALAGQVGLKFTVLDDQQLAELGAGAIVAVGKGSNTPSRLIILEHAGSAGGQPVALVGKALTMDTGGYSIKSTDGIQGMKYDKSGGMVVLATLVAAARLGLPTPVVGLIAAAENMISAASYRPDDILKAFNGKTIEIISTDAEGRLVLADALAYAEKTYQPRAMIDIATLTGAVVVALGSVRAGLLSNNDELAGALFKAGEKTFERVWRMPLDEEYFEQIKGSDSDIKNSGGRKAGSIIGGMFLKQFVTDATPWAHMDVAGVMETDKDLPYCPKGGMGFGVRLFVDYLTNLE